MRQSYPQPLILPPIAPVYIRIYGQLIGPMNQPIPNVKITLRTITTNLEIIQRQSNTAQADSNGQYDFTVNPGRYAVFLYIEGKDTRVDNITVYGDSAAGSLQSFMLTPTYDELTPLMVQETIAGYEGATAAELRARQWAENPIDVPVIDMNTGYGPEFSAYHWAHKAKEQMDIDTNINWRKEWSSTTAYAFRDAVRYQGSAYYCIEANTGKAPPTADIADNAIWSLMARKGDNSTVKGPPGPSNTLTIGTVTAVPYGTNPAVTISGASPDQILNFKLETGPGGTPADMSNYYNKTEVTNLINADLANYYTKTQIDAMFSGGGVVPSGAVGSWSLMTTESSEVAYAFGQSVTASDLIFASLNLTSPGPEWKVVITDVKPSGTWRMGSDVSTAGYSWGTLFLAQRIA